MTAERRHALAPVAVEHRDRRERRSGEDCRAARVVPRSGVVGLRLPPLRAAVLNVAPGDVLVLATDGLRPELISRLGVGAAPQPLAHELLQRHAMDSDDALVLVARYRGGSRWP